MTQTIPQSTIDRIVTLDHPVTHEEWEMDWSDREERF